MIGWVADNVVVVWWVLDVPQSWHHGKESDVTDALGADPADLGEWGDPLVTSYRGGRLFFMDAHGVPAFLEALKYEEASPSTFMFRR